MSSPPFSFSTTSEEVATHHSSQIKNKTILITGVSPNGLGLHTAKTLAAHSPKLLILAGRSSSTLNTSKTQILETSPGCSIKVLQLDLSSIAAVRDAVKELNGWNDVEGIDIEGIDILINNAGIMNHEFELSGDGIESNFATNHVGPWLFTNLLMPKLLPVKGRVVFLSSIGHMYSPVLFDNYNFDNGKTYNPDTAYGSSKTAAILTAKSLTTKLSSRGITAFSVHPGLVLTNITRSTPESVLKAKGFLDEMGNITTLIPTKTLSQGSATMLVAALDPEIKHKSGAYLADCQVDHTDMVAPWVVDEGKVGEDAEKLWKVSEEIVGERFAW